jgi:hypothetical protein
MSLAEGVATRVAYKFYSDPTITPGTEPSPASDPAATGGQVLRRVSASMTLQKDTYQSAEIRSDRQIGDFRHGTKRAPGGISGELSPKTYEDLFESSMRGTWSSGAQLDYTDLTSVTADNSSSKMTFGGGDPISLGMRVGYILRFSGLTQSANNDKNFVITSIGGSNNREVTVYPAPTTATSDSSFDVVVAGSSLIIPASSHVKRKLAIEVYDAGLDMARLFTECRSGGFNIQLPPTGMSTVDFDFMGRNMATYESVSAPFFSAPSDVTTTGIIAAVNGLLRVSGQTVGVVTGLNIQHQMDLSGPAVVGTDLVPEIFQGRSVVSGQITALFADMDLINDFINENEIEILAYLTTTSAANSPAMTFYLPRVKLGGADLPAQGEQEQVITLPFQALRYLGDTATTGIASTTLQICDTEVA